MTQKEAPSVKATMRAINESCKKKGGHYAGYSCQVVSWDDAQRGTVQGGLSCWGSNITDTYLKSRSGAQLFTLRSQNWNERLGLVAAQRVAVVASAAGAGKTAAPVTLKKVLEELGSYGSYAGLDPSTKLNAESDVKCSIRFQTTFLPMEAAGKLEFATEAYNYNTLSDAQPRNLILLCTSQGMALQQDGRGAKKLFHHAVDDAGKIHRYWLEAEESRHKVGGEQRETAEERAAALARGKATSSVIGIEAMGQRFNVLMTIQIPLQQQVPRILPTANCKIVEENGQIVVTTTSCYGQEDLDGSSKYLMNLDLKARSRSRSPGRTLRALTRPKSARPPGAAPRPAARRPPACAARVSRGTEEDVWPGLSVTSPKRSDEHVTITVVMYHAVTSAVPSMEDVTAAIDDLEALYAACEENGRLADDTFDFAKKPLELDDVIGISKKVHFQPPPAEVVGFDTFPV